MPACHSDATAARPKENQPTRLSIPRYWSASVARPLWVNFCRAISWNARLLYPAELPRRPFAIEAVTGP
jgi:hypothetical protein